MLTECRALSGHVTYVSLLKPHTTLRGNTVALHSKLRHRVNGPPRLAFIRGSVEHAQVHGL